VTVGALGVSYVVIGLGCAVMLRRGWLDAALLLLCWPLYAPFLWPGARDVEFTDLLPPEEAERLRARIRLARARMRRIDALLASPDFDPVATRVRAEALRAVKHTGAAEVAKRNLRNIERLQDTRARAAAELACVDELLLQIRTQAAVLRLSNASATSLVDALVERVELLDSVLEDELFAA